MKKIRQEINDFINRGMDSHLKLAVTGLSRAGKTAFITSLVNQMLHSSTADNLPLFHVSRDRRLIGAKRVPQQNLMVPRFGYDESMEALFSQPPCWPVPTRDVSEIRLAIKFRPEKGAKKLISDSSTLYLDIIDYPGEWLLDLPLLDLTFEQWCETQFESMKGKRKQLAEQWMQLEQQQDLMATADEKQIEQVSQAYTQYLHSCKDAGLHWVQPGRFVLPGDLDGAPVLQFYPVQLKGKEKQLQKAAKDSNFQMLKSRYREYQNSVVKRFYKEHFSTFDRQIVLVDCLQPLNAGQEPFYDMRDALEQILKSFKYGRSSMLKRLFAPRIDKILFAATKADHITPDQHSHQVSLLQQLIHPSWQHAAYENIDMECISIASIKATSNGFVSDGEQNIPAIQGVTLSGEPMTLFPGEVPKKLPKADFWQNNRFDFNSFLPLESEADAPLAHIRLDKAIQYLIGDKLK
ncbi:YcjX family protein [Vibrio sp. SCSIO 43137]|uniref:YcjX family protein n=1 Tax=Vibrio sp. SCSIO 43137 TaxID=3021011 RepID=UPI0023072A44|nr:YcjX family protein [Vibrio sp. SCSIO 43137]WCE28330.1 YcjX family protein [Vibrio sp. SCSIO 43137]